MFKVNNRNIFNKLLTYFTPYFSVSTVNFEQVNAGWVQNTRNAIIKSNLGS